MKLGKRSHVFAVRASAMLGTSAGPPTSFAWTNGSAPKAAIVPKPPLFSNATRITFAFASSDPGATFECSIDGAPGAVCTSPEEYHGLGGGAHTFAVVAVDAAGRKGKPASHTWTIDLVPPETTITTGPPAATPSTRASFKLASSEQKSTFACSLDGGPFTACKNSPSYRNLAPGQHTFEAKATDPSGNTDSTAAAWSWSIG